MIGNENETVLRVYIERSDTKKVFFLCSFVSRKKDANMFEKLNMERVKRIKNVISVLKLGIKDKSFL